MLRATTETRQTERRLAVPSVAVVQDREVSVNNGSEVIVFINISHLLSLVFQEWVVQHNSHISALYKALEARRGLTQWILAILVIILTTIIATFTIAHFEKTADIAAMNGELNLMKMNISLAENNFKSRIQALEKLENRVGVLEKLEIRIQALETLENRVGALENLESRIQALENRIQAQENHESRIQALEKL